MMLAWMSLPIATTAMPKSSAPIWRRTSTVVASASTTVAKSPEHLRTTAASASIASTSWPRRVIVWASAWPNRPRPMTRTCSLLLANEWSLLGIREQALTLMHAQSHGEREWTNAPKVHERDLDQLSCRAEMGGDPRRESHVGKRG